MAASPLDLPLPRLCLPSAGDLASHKQTYTASPPGPVRTTVLRGCDPRGQLGNGQAGAPIGPLLWLLRSEMGATHLIRRGDRLAFAHLNARRHGSGPPLRVRHAVHAWIGLSQGGPPQCLLVPVRGGSV